MVVIGLECLFILVAVIGSTYGAAIPKVRLSKRAAVTTDPSDLDGQTFDYVIAGAGTAGSVLANRLSAAGHTVAVVEAGLSGYESGTTTQNRLLSPALAYQDGLTGSSYDWQYVTVPQSQLHNRTIRWPRGKILGGSSAINGLYLVAPSQAEHDLWATMVNDSNWSWSTTYASRKRAQIYGALNSDDVQALDMVQNTSYWNSSGKVHYSFPPTLYELQESAWIPSFAALGVPTRDPGDGHSIGALVTTIAIDPSNYTRSYAYTGYLLPALTRSNLTVLMGYTVTQINFDGTNATGLSFSASSDDDTYTVNARKEVILAGGVIGSPQLLMVSGVGPSDLLGNLSIPVVNDLPGVGQGLREHISAPMWFDVSGNVNQTGDSLKQSASFAAQQLDEWQNGDPSNSLYSVSNYMIAMLNLSTIMNGTSQANALVSAIKANLSNYANTIGDPSVAAGYTNVSYADLNTLIPDGLGVVEILQVNTGSYGTYGSKLTMGIQGALQRPFSRGSVSITSSSVFSNPTIQAGYLSHWADLQILVNAFKFIRKLSRQQPLSDLIVGELSPGTDNVNTDAQWADWLRGQLSTEYSPLGTCAMLPQSLGGVVDSQLRVYGISNLRVVDASVIPINVAAHGCAPTYYLAETAAQIILGSLAPSALNSSSLPASPSGGGIFTLPVPTSTASSQPSASLSQVP